MVVTIVNEQKEFSVNYKYAGMASSAAYPTTGIEMPLAVRLISLSCVVPLLLV